MGGAIWSCTCDVTPSTRASYDVHYSKLTLLSAQGTMAEPDLQGVVLNQEYRVKLGKSFTFPKENAFHTIKCEGDVGQCSHVLYLMPTRRLFSAGFHLYLSSYPSCFPLPPSLLFSLPPSLPHVPSPSLPLVLSPSLPPGPSSADDFKPLSVDHSKPGKLRVGEGDEVNMSLPVVQVSYTYSTLILCNV